MKMCNARPLLPVRNSSRSSVAKKPVRGSPCHSSCALDKEERWRWRFTGLALLQPKSIQCGGQGAVSVVATVHWIFLKGMWAMGCEAQFGQSGRPNNGCQYCRCAADMPTIAKKSHNLAALLTPPLLPARRDSFWRRACKIRVGIPVGHVVPVNVVDDHVTIGRVLQPGISDLLWYPHPLRHN